jgi:hypothetical protein
MISVEGIIETSLEWAGDLYRRIRWELNGNASLMDVGFYFVLVGSAVLALYIFDWLRFRFSSSYRLQVFEAQAEREIEENKRLEKEILIKQLASKKERNYLRHK